MQKKHVKAFAPATIANVACGFDVLGLAIDYPGDEIEISLNDTGIISIEKIEGDNGQLPRDINKNAASVVVRDYLQLIGEKVGASIAIYKKMPSGSGLGSSAASAVVAGFAINALFNFRLTKDELLPICINGEEAACGARIADNVSASLFGGITMVNSYTPLTVAKLPIPENLFATVIHPHITVLTKDAREILPSSFPLKDIVKQQGAMASFISGLYENNFEKIGFGLQDFLVEPFRKKLIPHFDLLKESALANGALGCSISGSGPSVFALSNDENNAKKIELGFRKIFEKETISFETYLSKVNVEGPRIIDLV